MTELMHPPHVAERALSRVTVDGRGCWVFPGVNGQGYGQINDKGKVWRVHRLVRLHLVGPLTPGLQLDHLCRNRACCNPDHLEEVDARTNNLRGESMAAYHARQTHCVSGHEFTPENTSIIQGKVRRCKQCACDREKRYRSAA